jgi:hypothetical protein
MSNLLLLGRGGGRWPAPNFNEEFDAPVSPAWQALASSPGTYDVNSTSPGHLYMAGGSGTGAVGIYRSIPAMPFTVTAFISSNGLNNGEFSDVGLLLGEATPGKFIHGCWDVSVLGHFNVLGSYWPSPTVWSNNFSDFGNVGSTALAHYTRFVVHSSTNVDGYYSTDGVSWSQWLTAYNPGFTIGSVGLDMHAPAGRACAVDWIRFT